MAVGLTGNKEIQHIVGDTFVYSLDLFDGAGKPLGATRVVFTCASLGLEREFERDSTGRWIVTYSAEETELWKSRRTTYDVTVYIDDVVISQTGIPLQIIKKNNPTADQEVQNV